MVTANVGDRIRWTMRTGRVCEGYIAFIVEQGQPAPVVGKFQHVNTRNHRYIVDCGVYTDFKRSGVDTIEYQSVPFSMEIELVDDEIETEGTLLNVHTMPRRCMDKEYTHHAVKAVKPEIYWQLAEQHGLGGIPISAQKDALSQ